MTAVYDDKDFDSAAATASRLHRVITDIRTGKAEDAEFLLQLKPLEELLCFYEVNPSGVSLAELRTAERAAEDYRSGIRH